jgi:ATP-dependent Clp protease adapter protein ClpS
MKKPTENSDLTAVEWLFLMLNDPNKNQEFARKLLDKALELEKQQIMMAWHNGKINEQDFFSDHTETIVRANCAEQYYNETYKPSA